MWIDAPSYSAQTPLHYAVEMGRYGCAAALLQAGAARDAPSSGPNKQTPAELAADTWPAHSKLVKLLRGNGPGAAAATTAAAAAAAGVLPARPARKSRELLSLVDHGDAASLAVAVAGGGGGGGGHAALMFDPNMAVPMPAAARGMAASG